MENASQYYMRYYQQANPPMNMVMGGPTDTGDRLTRRTTTVHHNVSSTNNNNNSRGGSSSTTRYQPNNNNNNNNSHSSSYSSMRFTEPVKRIILIRNGHSAANENLNTYVTTPDWRIPLVREGVEQCLAAGRDVADRIGSEPVYFYYSPYIRSRQSLRYVLQGYDERRRSQLTPHPWWSTEEELSADRRRVEQATSSSPSPSSSSPSPSSPPPPLIDPVHSTNSNQNKDLLFLQQESSDIIGVREDVRLRDGDIGRYKSLEELQFHIQERERYGEFFYRFPFGESGADVCDRVTSFLDAFQRERVNFPMDTNVVIITHGLTMRMFVKRWFHLTVDTFHKMRSPPSGSVCTLTRLHHRSCFRMDESCVESMRLPYSLNENNGYKYRNKQLLGSMSSGAPYM